MERAEAFKTLRLDPSADGHMVENAYWTLVRQAQRRAEREPAAYGDIEQLNEAYGALTPEAAPLAMRTWSPRARKATSVFDAVADWFAEEALRTRARWPGRNLEIALIGGGALALAFLALAAGTSFWGVLVTFGLVCAGIWAPWRKTSPRSGQDD